MVVTDSYYCRATDPEVVPSSSTGQDPSMVPVGITDSSHQAVPHYLRVSSFDSSLYSELLFLFLYHLLVLRSGTRVSECLGSSQEWSQECYALLGHCGTRQDHLRSQACMVISSELSVPAMVPVWLSSWPCSLSNPLYWPLLMVFCLKIIPSWGSSQLQVGFFSCPACFQS